MTASRRNRTPKNINDVRRNSVIKSLETLVKLDKIVPKKQKEEEVDVRLVNTFNVPWDIKSSGRTGRTGRTRKVSNKSRKTKSSRKKKSVRKATKSVRKATKSSRKTISRKTKEFKTPVVEMPAIEIPAIEMPVVKKENSLFVL